jgi:hypothetical protein
MKEERGIAGGTMRLRAFAGLVVGAALAGCGLTKEEQAVVDASLALPHAQDWKLISWEPSWESARLRALREDKPILAFIYVNERGEKGAADC